MTIRALRGTEELRPYAIFCFSEDEHRLVPVPEGRTSYAHTQPGYAGLVYGKDRFRCPKCSEKLDFRP